MCGIAGILAPAGVSPLLLRGMLQTMRHRGPDDEGYLLLEAPAGAPTPHRGDDSVPDAIAGASDVRSARRATVALGHRRLSIIDTSPAGHQPMPDESRQAWVVLNGEIYNYVELREELRALGHSFRSDSDTEVLLAAYMAWGERCVERFDGQFAFAIFDARSGRLFCARDRLGVKPFYYATSEADGGAHFAFASEIKALLSLPSVSREINEGALAAFLVHSRHEDGTDTFFRHVTALPGGCTLTVAPGEPPSIRRYWDLPRAGVGRFDAAGATQAAAGVRDLFFEGVQRRLRSDVPVGFCISGGLDSSSIVSVAQELVREQPLAQVGSNLRAFTSYFEDAGFDERSFAQAVTGRGHVEHHLTSPDAAGLIRDFDHITWHQDEPISSPGVYMQYDLMRLIASNGVRVVLDGQGGDELLGGYRPHAGAHLRDSLLRLRLREAMTPPASGGLVNVWGHAAHQALHVLTGPLAHSVEARLRPGAAEVLHPDLVALARSREQSCAPTGHLNEVLARDLTKEMLPHLLRFEDRNSMAFSVEARVPFSDSGPLADFVAAQPAAYKIHGGWSKYLLREAMRGVLPDEVRTRRSKLGFSVPQARWARDVAASPLGRGLLEVDQPYITRDALASVLADAGAGRGPALFWRLLSAFRWLEVVVNAPRTSEGS